MTLCLEFAAAIGDGGRLLKTYSYDDKEGYILDGLYYKTIADLLSGNNYTPKMPKRIYTVEEAVEAVSPKGRNTFSIRYR